MSVVTINSEIVTRLERWIHFKEKIQTNSTQKEKVMVGTHNLMRWKKWNNGRRWGLPGNTGLHLRGGNESWKWKRKRDGKRRRHEFFKANLLDRAFLGYPNIFRLHRKQDLNCVMDRLCVASNNQSVLDDGDGSKRKMLNHLSNWKIVLDSILKQNFTTSSWKTNHMLQRGENIPLSKY